MHRFTVAHPEVRLEVLDRMELGGGLSLFETRIQSDRRGSWREELLTLPGVKDVEQIDSTEGSEVCRIFFRGKTFTPLLKRLRLVGQFPFPVNNGVATWNVAGPEGKVRELLKNLATQSAGFHVDSVRHGPLLRNPSALTPHQQEILHHAQVAGYFDVPRRISLTRLASKEGVAISTLSVTLATIEKKILEPHA
jgi:predicted DNA binding protein